ncbi:MAG: HEPN domain-containing protein [Candidatus Tectomicrobia bacterium]
MAGQRQAEATRWCQQARHDLAAARWNIQGGFCDTACFLAQQAAEKALKSLLYCLGARRTALLTHSLVEMVCGSGEKWVKWLLCLMMPGCSTCITSRLAVPG